MSVANPSRLASPAPDTSQVACGVPVDWFSQATGLEQAALDVSGTYAWRTVALITASNKSKRPGMAPGRLLGPSGSARSRLCGRWARRREDRARLAPTGVDLARAAADRPF